MSSIEDKFMKAASYEEVKGKQDLDKIFESYKFNLEKRLRSDFEK